MLKQLDTALYARGVALCPSLTRRASAPLARAGGDRTLAACAATRRPIGGAAPAALRLPQETGVHRRRTALKIASAVFALLTIFSSGIFAQQAENAAKKMKFKEVKGYTSEQEYLADKFKGKPWVDAGSGAIRFYNAAGKVKKEIKGSFSRREESLSENTRLHKDVDLFEDHSGVLLEERVSSDMPGVSTASWTIFDAEGNEKAKIRDNKAKGYLKRAPNGKYFLLSHWIGEGYGMDGKLAFIGRFRVYRG